MAIEKYHILDLFLEFQPPIRGSKMQTCVNVKETERETNRERERDRQTDRQETEKCKESHRDRQAGR